MLFKSAPQFTCFNDILLPLDIQCGVVTLVGSLGDGAHRVGVADHTHPGRAVVELLGHIPAGALTQGADDGGTGDENFLTVLGLTPNAILRDLETPAAGVHSAELVELLQQQRALTDLTAHLQAPICSNTDSPRQIPPECIHMPLGLDFFAACLL